ncbi:MAG: hypothetical protein U0234_06375 [Sandaracinus sp.]
MPPKRSFPTVPVLALAASGVVALACAPRGARSTPRASGLPASPGDDWPSVVVLEQADLFPETLVASPDGEGFLVGSMREGRVLEVARDGSVSPLVDDPRLCSVLGMAIDPDRGWIWVVSADAGVSTRPSAGGARALAVVAAYDASTGASMRYVDLAPLFPGPHLPNGIALGPDGTAYVTDSFAPVIYRVGPDGDAEVFVRDPRFEGEGVHLNGLVVHPDGYLLVVDKTRGALYRVPIENPTRVSEVTLDAPLPGADGLMLVGERDLVVVANRVPAAATDAAVVLRSTDGFAAAGEIGRVDLGSVYPTTSALRGNRVYAIHSQLDVLLGSAGRAVGPWSEIATIVEIGRVDDRHARVASLALPVADERRSGP